MADPDPPLPEDEADEKRQYGQFTAGDALVVYDRDDTSRWIESDYVVSVADVR